MPDDGPRAPRVISSERPFTGRLVKVRVDMVETARGISVREVVEHPGAVLMVAVDERDCVYFVRQYRHPSGRVLMELPAGTIDEGESPEACAERELREEIGLRPRALQSMGGFFLSPGYSNEYIHVFLATGLEPAPLDTGDEEDLRVVEVSWAEALHLIDSGAIQDAKSIAALLLVALRRSVE